MFKFNIGSAVNGIDQAIEESTVLAALQHVGIHGARVEHKAMSDTETTFIITAGGHRKYNAVGLPWTHGAAVHAVCLLLSQDAIAYTVDGEGFLVGPKAEDWGGEFNPEYFIE